MSVESVPDELVEVATRAVLASWDTRTWSAGVGFAAARVARAVLSAASQGWVRAEELDESEQEWSATSGEYTIERNGRTYRLYGCAKRGCDAVNPDYLSFGAHGKSWCLGHRPLRARLHVWWQERRGA